MIELVLYFWTASWWRQTQSCLMIMTSDGPLKTRCSKTSGSISSSSSLCQSNEIQSSFLEDVVSITFKRALLYDKLFMFKRTNSHFDTARDVFVAQHDLVQLKATTPGCFIRQHVFLLLRDTHKSAYYWYRFVFRKLIFMLPSSHFVLRRNIFIRAKAEIST